MAQIFFSLNIKDQNLKEFEEINLIMKIISMGWMGWMG